MTEVDDRAKHEAILAAARRFAASGEPFERHIPYMDVEETGVISLSGRVRQDPEIGIAVHDYSRTTAFSSNGETGTGFGGSYTSAEVDIYHHERHVFSASTHVQRDALLPEPVGSPGTYVTRHYRQGSWELHLQQLSQQPAAPRSTRRS